MTAVPGAVDALLDLVRNAPDLTGVRILDGPSTEDTLADPDILIVGDSPEDADAVEYTDAIAGLEVNREQFDINCRAIAWRGETDIKPVRDRVDELVEAVRGELEADPRLGGAVTRARLTTLSLDQDQTQQGAAAVVSFVVRVDAYRR